MTPNLSIRQLQTFREIMRSGSVTAAARVLGRTQPSVSAMLASLEAEFGFELFLRQKGRLVPTPEAHFFFAEAEEILERVTRSAQAMREIGDLDRGRLKIACYPGGSLFILPRIVAGFDDGMSSFRGQVSEEEILALISYLKSLPAETTAAAATAAESGIR